MTEKKSITDALNVQGYDESTSANLDRAMGHVPVAGTVYKSGKSIAAHAQQAAQADSAGELASAGAALVGDGAAFVGAARHLHRVPGEILDKGRGSDEEVPDRHLCR